MSTLNREAWLEGAVKALVPVFSDAGLVIPDLRVSVGWPSRGGVSARAQTIGQCWFGSMAADGIPQLFISPVLSDPLDPIGVLPTLVHEICHTVAGPKAKHGAVFKRVAVSVGLEGKMTCTHAGEGLITRLRPIVEHLGPFPHAKLTPTKRVGTEKCRLLKCECATCGYIVRTTAKWLAVGAPLCPVDREPMIEEGVSLNPEKDLE